MTAKSKRYIALLLVDNWYVLELKFQFSIDFNFQICFFLRTCYGLLCLFLIVFVLMHKSLRIF